MNTIIKRKDGCLSLVKESQVSLGLDYEQNRHHSFTNEIVKVAEALLKGNCTQDFLSDFDFHDVSDQDALMISKAIVRLRCKKAPQNDDKA